MYAVVPIICKLSEGRIPARYGYYFSIPSIFVSLYCRSKNKAPATSGQPQSLSVILHRRSVLRLNHPKSSIFSGYAKRTLSRNPPGTKGHSATFKYFAKCVLNNILISDNCHTSLTASPPIYLNIYIGNIEQIGLHFSVE